MIARHKFALAVAGTLAVAAAPSSAHPSAGQEITELTHRIESSPKDAGLWLQRASLHRESRNWAAALADCAAAAKLQPAAPAPVIEKARVLIACGWSADAIVLLDRILAKENGLVQALEVRSQAYESAGNLSAAAEDIASAISHSHPPQPDQYARRAELTSDTAAALAGVEEGLQKLGLIPSLAEKAVDLQCKLGRHHDALRRLDTMLQAHPAHLPWLCLKAEVCAALADPAAAQSTWKEALAAIERLPSRRQSTAGMVAMRQKIEKHLVRPARS